MICTLETQKGWRFSSSLRPASENQESQWYNYQSKCWKTPMSQCEDNQMERGKLLSSFLFYSASNGLNETTHIEDSLYFTQSTNTTLILCRNILADIPKNNVPPTMSIPSWDKINYYIYLYCDFQVRDNIYSWHSQIHRKRSQNT